MSDSQDVERLVRRLTEKQIEILVRVAASVATPPGGAYLPLRTLRALARLGLAKILAERACLTSRGREVLHELHRPRWRDLSPLGKQLYACDCAERVLPLYARENPSEVRALSRLRDAVSQARRLALGHTSGVDLVSLEAELFELQDLTHDAEIRTRGSVFLAGHHVVNDVIGALRSSFPSIDFIQSAYVDGNGWRRVDLALRAWEERRLRLYARPEEALGDARLSTEGRGLVLLEGEPDHVALASYYREERLRDLDLAADDPGYRRAIFGSGDLEVVFQARSDALERLNARDWTRLAYSPVAGWRYQED